MNSYPNRKSPAPRRSFSPVPSSRKERGRSPALIRVVAEPQHASFFLVSDEKEIDAYFRQMVEMRASDLHLSSGSVPMVRHDGEMKALPGATEKTQSGGGSPAVPKGARR